ncbi:MAG: DUF1566 domain-containing protein [Bacteroidota bacterium]|jgi:hypothetical protein
MKKPIIASLLFIISIFTFAQSTTKSMLRLPDTGQKNSYTNTFGEDNDYSINLPFYIDNKNGTITDTVTGLMWQQTDGGEMTIENARIYCDTLILGTFTNWRLPNVHEAFSILNLQNNNPALDILYFTKTAAEYWWTSDKQSNDITKIWVTNAGGGIGNHQKTETISAGGTKKFHVRAVRDVTTPTVIPNHFTDNGNGTITDHLTNLVWQKEPNTNAVSWENAILYANNLILENDSDWRMPNIKELQSLNDEGFVSPSVNTNIFSNMGVKKYWSSTTQQNQVANAWYWNTQFGITTYDPKINTNFIICVRTKTSNSPTKIKAIESTKTEFIVYPNPFTHKIEIKNLKANSIIEINNLMGKSVYKGIYNENMDFSYLKNGLYFLTILSNNNLTFKLIKE